MKGILFNQQTGMLKSVIDGNKTMTRRIINPQPDDNGLHDHTKLPMSLESKLQGYWGEVEETGESREFKPRYFVGENVYIKEGYFIAKSEGGLVYYKLDFPDLLKGLPEKWNNPMFCEERFARHFIRITNRRVERLQDITQEDCLKEGIITYESGDFPNYEYCMSKDNQQDDWGVMTAKESFETLINYINGKNTWEKNPWVWVYEFEKIIFK